MIRWSYLELACGDIARHKVNISIGNILISGSYVMVAENLFQFAKELYVS